MDWLNNLVAKVTGKGGQSQAPLTTVSTKYEINLVPEVKHQMIKAQKLRNLVLFVCIVVSAASFGVVAVLFSIKSGQDIAMSSQDKRLETMSAKLMGFEELGDLVTVQGQLGKLQELANNKKVLSRVFGALGAMLPTGGDSVQLSELRVDLDTNTLRMEAQADARIAPLIDYRVLESFKKGVALTKYDYGRYVDANGNEIPTWCIAEADGDGAPYRKGENYYAWWNLNAEGCAALPVGSSSREDEDGENPVELFYSKDAETETSETEVPEDELMDAGIKFETDAEGEITVTDKNVEKKEVDGRTMYVVKKVDRVKVWRTPQFTEWHHSGVMELNGTISGIEHFESACIKYSGTSQGNDAAKWTSENDCMLAPDGLTVSASSNGRDESNNLVLRFTANLTVEPEFFAFRNKHMMAIGPVGQNVTDSYVQIGGMFTRPATECAEGDKECMTNTANHSESSEDEKGGAGSTSGSGTNSSSSSSSSSASSSSTRNTNNTNQGGNN